MSKFKDKGSSNFRWFLCIYLLFAIVAFLGCMINFKNFIHFSRFIYFSIIFLLWFIIQEITVEYFRDRSIGYKVRYKSNKRIQGVSIKGLDNKYYSHTGSTSNLDVFIKDTSKSFITECSIYYADGSSVEKTAYILSNKNKSKKVVIDNKGYAVKVTLPIMEKGDV